MIAYFDTSSLLPLLIEEPGSEAAGSLWHQADRLLSIRLVYAEGHATLAQAARGGRLDQRQRGLAVTGLLTLYGQLDLVEVTDPLVRRAGYLAETHARRGYDALHLAAAEFVNDGELVFVSGDASLSQAAAQLGMHVVKT